MNPVVAVGSASPTARLRGAAPHPALPTGAPLGSEGRDGPPAQRSFASRARAPAPGPRSRSSRRSSGSDRVGASCAAREGHATARPGTSRGPLNGVPRCSDPARRTFGETCTCLRPSTWWKSDRRAAERVELLARYTPRCHFAASSRSSTGGRQQATREAGGQPRLALSGRLGHLR
jgi:hypothetical protein